MHSKRRSKICICSVVLGQLESFRNYKGLSIIFPKIVDVILSFAKMRIFLIFLSVAFSNPNILGFLFLQKNSLTWGLKCEKRREFIRYAAKIVHKWNGHLEIF